MGESKTSTKRPSIQHDNKIFGFRTNNIEKYTKVCVRLACLLLTVGLPLRMKMNNLRPL